MIRKWKQTKNKQKLVKIDNVLYSYIIHYVYYE